MASSSFELDDQTDEDFFDKLVNDDLDFGGSSKPIGVVETSEVVLANAVENLSISAVEKPEIVDLVSEDSFGFGDGLAEKANLELLNSSAVSAESKAIELESESGKVKVVQWDSFTSDSDNLRGSYSDLFSGFGESSDDPFANVGGGENSVVQSSVENVALAESFVGALGSSNHEKTRVDQQNYGDSVDLSSSQHWENAYPGWQYDSSTGQWYQVADHNANANSNGDLNSSAYYQGSSNVISSTTSTQISGHSYSEQTAVNNAVATGSGSDWNQVSQGSTEYPSNMVFDPQYPGFYFDTTSMEWKSLESYKPTVDYSKSVDGGQQYANKTDQYYPTQSNATQQESVAKWDGSHGGYNQQNASVWQTQQNVQSVTVGYNGIQQSGNQYSVKDHGNNNLGNHQQQMGSSQVFGGGFGVSSGVQNVNSQGNFAQFQGQVQEVKPQPQEAHFSAAPFNNGHNMALYSSQPMQSQSSSGLPYVGGGEERTSAKRPAHALVTFGFGGKLVVMKDTSSSFSSSVYGSQDAQGASGVINVYNLMEVVAEKNDASSSLGSGGCDYFDALCHQSFPGPLVGGNPGSKELNKWIDDKIASYETAYMDVAKRDLLRMLFSLLKIAVQYYGKLRSPFGSDQALKESDSPDSAVAKLFASAKTSQEFGNFMQCLQNIPSETQIQATAVEVQKLLVSGKKKEALEFAQEGQLWGPALVLASQLGDQPYGDTVKKMALNQLLPGSPLRTLCLLIAGQPADVFSNALTSVPGSLNTFQQPAQVRHKSFLDEWTQNLAIITANRTKDDELVIVHLGDNLWKETGEITAAHICYLVAEANLEQYSDSARLCLIGADHWKSPRTYASPEAIQRTELYEYSKVLGNSQFSLLPFQPYKLIYAYMLAEVGKVSVALKYCQAILKSLKTGRSPEVEAWRQLVSSLEDRIKTHQQGGYGTNLAQGGTKLVGKLLSIFDSTAHRVVGAMPPPIPSAAQGNAQHTDHAPQLGIQRISNSQSALSSPFLMPSSATENDNITMPNRSISEPDFSRSPRKVDSTKKENSSAAQEKTAAPGGSRFGRLFGSKLLQKTVGLVIRQRPDNEAKLGLEEMTFYYDENLKRWVERGVTPAAEQESLAPPPTSAAFQSGTQDYNSFQSTPQPDRFSTGPETRNSSPPEGSPGIPPVPPSSNQFSARGRSMVGRPRYVDTFNRSGPVATKTFHLPPTQGANKPVGGAKFFVPAAVPSSEQTSSESFQEGTITSNGSSSSLKDEASPPMTQFPTTPASAPAMQRYPSMDTIASRSGDMGRGGNYGSVPSNSRRTASWSGGLNEARDDNVSSTNEIRPLGEALGIPPQLYMAGNSAQHLRRNSGSFGDDLHEVQL